MKLNDPPDPLIEQALDKFAAEQGLTRTPRAALPPQSADGPALAAAPVEPQPHSDGLARPGEDPGEDSALKVPRTEAHDAGRT